MKATQTSTIPWWRTSFGEETIRKVADSIRGELISQGPVTAEFEARLAEALEVPYAVATTSGSMALLMAAMAAGLKRGDEVIVPNRTWIATAHAPHLLGAKVVLADVRADAPILDVARVEEKITARTRAIMPVHLGGRAVDMEALRALAEKRGLTVIEDAAQALFVRDKRGYLGTRSFAGCFSFSTAKLLPTGQGGCVATRDKKTFERLVRMRTHGVADVINCEFTDGGFNFRFTDILASVGLVQLGRCRERIGQLKAVYARYAAGLAGIESARLIPVDLAKGEIPMYVEALCPRRKKLVAFLAERDIQTRPFYPDLDTAGYLASPGEFPNSRVFAAQGLFLPCGPEQPEGNIDRVLEALREFDRTR